MNEWLWTLAAVLGAIAAGAVLGLIICQFLGVGFIRRRR